MNFDEFIETYQREEVIAYDHNVDPNPLLSIVVTTYQHKDFIKSCLDGILAQSTDFQYEIILGEDDSNDGTRAICIEYAQLYNTQIRLFLHHKANKISVRERPSGRFNLLYCIQQTKGKYIAICDGDDYWTDIQKMAKQVQFLEDNPDYSMTFCNYLRKSGESFSGAKQSFNKSIFQLREGINQMPNVFSMTMFRASTFPFDMPTVITSLLVIDNYWSSLALSQGKGYYDNAIMGVYRIHSNSIYSNSDKQRRLKLALYFRRQLLRYKLIPGQKAKRFLIQKIIQLYLAIVLNSLKPRK